MKAMYINLQDEFYYQLDEGDSFDNYPLGKKVKLLINDRRKLEGVVSRTTKRGIALKDWTVKEIEEKKDTFPWNKKRRI